MDRTDRKSKIREYKQTPRPAGIYRIRNTVTGRSLIGAAVDLPGRLNRYRFQLKAGSHAVAELQADWNELGEAAFEFSELDVLEPRDEPTYDPTEDLAALEEMWTEKLAASGESFYGGSGKTRR